MKELYIASKDTDTTPTIIASPENQLINTIFIMKIRSLRKRSNTVLKNR